MNVPTRDDLNRLLWSHPKSTAFENDAKAMLAFKPAERRFFSHEDEGILSAIKEVFAVATSGADNPNEWLEGKTEAQDLLDIAINAKRIAILLLHAAWAAEQAASPARTETKAEPPSTKREGSERPAPIEQIEQSVLHDNTH